MPPGSYHSYSDYLNHPRFLWVRAMVMARDSDTCRVCKTSPATEVHHRWYPAWGAFDLPENLIAICHPCHCRIEGKES